MLELGFAEVCLPSCVSVHKVSRKLTLSHGPNGQDVSESGRSTFHKAFEKRKGQVKVKIN